jgi:hypothetical protein
MPNFDAEAFCPRRLARIMGILGLAGIVLGAFDIGYVHNTLIVAGDASATLHNILTHETLFRLGFSAHLLELLINIPGEIIFFILFRRVNGTVAGVALCSGVVGIATEAVSLLSAYVPVQLMIGGSGLGAFTTEQLQALSHISEGLQVTGLLISFVFYGFDELLSGFLIFRSGFLPRILGVLLGISGFCYATNTFLSFVAPSLDARLNPYILYACFPGEFLSSLWFATMGLNIAKWRAGTAEPQSEVPFGLRQG